MSGLDQFEMIVTRFGKIAGFAIGGSALVPIVTAASGLAPSWPKGLGFLAALFMLLTLAATFHFLTTRKRRVFSVLFIVGSLLFTATIATHVVLVSKFTDVGPAGNPLILGCEWTHDAIEYAKEMGVDSRSQCPGDYRGILVSAEGNPAEIFTPGSILGVQLAMAASWLLFFVSLAFVLGSFVIWYAQAPAPRRADNGREQR